MPAKPQNEYINELFAQRKFFELHEKLELIWLAEPESKNKKFIQALIQLIVALHHAQNKNYKGFEILRQKALSKLKFNIQDYKTEEAIFNLVQKDLANLNL